MSEHSGNILTRSIFDYLKECARKMRTVNYGEIGNEVRINPKSIGWHLGIIRDQCRERRLPWINALAVNKATWLPGDKFLPDNIQMGDQDFEQFWRDKVIGTLAYDWSRVELFND